MRFINNPFRFFLKGILYPFLAWIFIVPFAFLVPKKKNLIIFIGNNGDKFCDNTKYLFLYLFNSKEKDMEYYYLLEDKNLYKKLEQENLPVLRYPGNIRTILKLLRTYITVVDHAAWIQKSKYHFLIGSKKIQLWHGVLFKGIELDMPYNQIAMKYRSIRVKNRLTGRFPVFDMVVSPSDFFSENYFPSAFKCKTIVSAGYPRNDIFFRDVNSRDLMGADSDAIHKVEDFKKQGFKIALYAPTFRDTGGDALSDRALDIERLEHFAHTHKVVFVFKSHQFRLFKHPVDETYILNYDPSLDVYPLLKIADLLIADFSSITLDFLLLNRPVIYFPYDFEKYVTKDRPLIFDYDRFTPGPKCYTQAELENEIITWMDGKDGFEEKRAQVSDVVFKYKDGNASRRILDYVKQEL